MQRAKLACRDRLDDWFDFWDGVNEYTADSKVSGLSKQATFAMLISAAAVCVAGEAVRGYMVL